MATKEELIQGVKEYAKKHYEDSFGWSEVVECWDDSDIEATIDNSTTVEQAVALVEILVSIRDERYSDAIGPMIECPDCGTKFGENTVCPKCRY